MILDPVIEYLQTWKDYKEGDERVPMLIKTYMIVRNREELKNWRFGPGKQRGKSKEPMYCAFAATPFSSNDWFILRLVKESNNKFAIGFCPDYGIQENSSAENQPFTDRRKVIRSALKAIENSNKVLLKSAPFPQSAPRPHAFKGFETKFTMPENAEKLAQKFIDIVLEWEKLFSRII